MASTIVTKNSSTASAVPVTGDLTQGELAVNVTDKRLFTKNSGGTVVELGTNPASLALPNGTANGVAYLNGSKVVTTGSALTYNGTNLGITGTTSDVKTVITATTGAPYTQYTNSGSTFYVGKENSAGTSFGVTAYSSVLFESANYPLVFAINSAEQMRLTSTGLGIGTSSPAVKLDVAGNATIQNGVLTIGKDTVYDAFINTPESMYFNVDSDGNSTGNRFVWGTDRTGTSGGTEWMRLDSSGNLGLGVTPSAWQSGRKAMQVGNASINSFSNSQNQLGANFYYDGTNNKYISSDFSTVYQQLSGQHQWYNAPSGTAGNAITFTQAMTLDASGNLLIGQTGTASALLTLADSSSGKGIGWGTTSANYANIWAAYSSGDLVLGGNVYGSSSADSYLSSYGGATPRAAMRISGFGGYISFATAGSTTTARGSAVTLTEVARIDSSGNLLVGTTAVVGSERLNVTANTGSYNARFINSNASPYGPMINYSGAAPNGTSNECWRFEDTGGLRFQVRSNGGVVNYSANNVNLSDRREKTNFAPAGDYLAKICAIPVQTFNYIDQNMEDDPGLTLGVVAQDVEAVAPELVMESNWGTEEEPKMRLSIYQTDLQYALMKALQELKAEFDAYKATHP